MKPTVIWKILQAFCRILSTLMFDLKVWGIHHVPDEGGVLLVSNHQSYLDPVLLAVRLRRPLSYMAKAQLFKNRAFAWLIRSLQAFPIRQGAGDVQAVKETIQRLHEGYALNIFPEGSRTMDGELLPIEKGVGLVVRKAKVPIVPVVIDGAYRAWPKGAKSLHPAPIRILYGPPMELSNLSRDEIAQRIGQTLHEMLARVRAWDGGAPP